MEPLHPQECRIVRAINSGEAFVQFLTRSVAPPFNIQAGTDVEGRTREN